MTDFTAEDQARLGLLVVVLALTAAFAVGYWGAWAIWWLAWGHAW